MKLWIKWTITFVVLLVWSINIGVNKSELLLRDISAEAYSPFYYNEYELSKQEVVDMLFYADFEISEVTKQQAETSYRDYNMQCIWKKQYALELASRLNIIINITDISCGHYLKDGYYIRILNTRKIPRAVCQVSQIIDKGYFDYYDLSNYTNKCSGGGGAGLFAGSFIS